jgi:hypothetical protein
LDGEKLVRRYVVRVYQQDLWWREDGLPGEPVAVDFMDEATVGAADEYEAAARAYTVCVAPLRLQMMAHLKAPQAMRNAELDRASIAASVSECSVWCGQYKYDNGHTVWYFSVFEAS